MLFKPVRRSRSTRTQTPRRRSTRAAQRTECTLREAIEAANADPADNTIQFSLAGSTEIDLGSALPAIVGKVAILGSSQPAGQVTVNGAGVSEGASAFLLGNGSDGSEIHDLAIEHFSGGVGIEVVSASNSVSGNDISAVDTGSTRHWPDASANQIGGARSRRDRQSDLGLRLVRDPPRHRGHG